jgi:hypothetical protein
VVKPKIGLTEGPFNSCYAPLCVLSYVLHERGILEPLRKSSFIGAKESEHSPGDKLLDAFLLILAGYPSLYLLNTTLRPDLVLAQSWGRQQLAEQSNVSRTLDSCDEVALAELRALSWDFWRQHSQLPQHDWRKQLLLDLDLTPLLASSGAEGSTRGYLGKKTRQVANWLGS